MNWKRKAAGGALALIGFLLSPLSWWNDLFVNVPLALGFAWGVAWFHRPAFEAALIVGYWLTNVLGLLLLHHGTRRMLSEGHAPACRARHLGRDAGVALLYTLLIVVLIKLRVLQPITDYFR